jgi:hypothetical protein
MILFDYAWSHPGDAIKTAQESNNPNDLVQAPTFDSLGGLALGRPGAERRNQRAMAPANQQAG